MAASRVALEVGPGEGAFLVELAPLFDEVHALDTSAAMLAAAQQQVANARLENVFSARRYQRRAAEGPECGLRSDQYGVAPCAGSGALFREIAPVLSPGASLIVTELCRHDQVWTRERCGDVWLGFEPEDLDHWAAQAGLVPGRSLYLAQRNGFRVQIRQFVSGGAPKLFRTY